MKINKEKVHAFLHQYIKKHKHFPPHKEISKKFGWNLAYSGKLVRQLVADDTVKRCTICKRGKIQLIGIK